MKVVSYVIKKLKVLRWRYLNRRVLINDASKYLDVCAGSARSRADGSRYARDILIDCHVVEKGLSHKKLKPLFGLERMKSLGESLRNYVSVDDTDSFIIQYGINALKEYNQVNMNLGIDGRKLLQILADIYQTKMQVGGKKHFRKRFLLEY